MYGLFVSYSSTVKPSTTQRKVSAYTFCRSIIPIVSQFHFLLSEAPCTELVINSELHVGRLRPELNKKNMIGWRGMQKAPVTTASYCSSNHDPSGFCSPSVSQSKPILLTSAFGSYNAWSWAVVFSNQVPVNHREPRINVLRSSITVLLVIADGSKMIPKKQSRQEGVTSR